MNNNNNIVKTMVICFEHYRFSFTAMAGCYIQHLWPELWQVINETVTRNLIWGFSETISKYSRQFYLESRLRWKKNLENVSEWARPMFEASVDSRSVEIQGHSNVTLMASLKKRHTHTHRHTCLRANTHLHTQTHTHTHAHTHTDTHTHSHTHTHTHTFTHSNAHSMTYSRVGPKPSQFAGIGVVATKQADK